MYCKNCGNQINGNEKFCPSCGYNQALSVQRTPTADEMEQSRAASSVFKMGLFSFIFCLPILGFILSIIAKSKATKYKRRYGSLSGKAKTGYTFAKISFIFGIIMLYAAFVCVTVLIALLTA